MRTALLLLATATATAGEPTRFEKLAGVLEHLGVAPEPSYYEDLRHLDGAQTRQGFETILRYVDPKGALARYARWDDHKLIVFQDRDDRQVVDYSLAFKKDGAPNDPLGLVHAMRRAALNPSSEPLAGMRVALDPGHMGGPLWDRITGKYVRPKTGGYLSEGVLALQTSLLLTARLRRLGATVLLTRDADGPVSELPPETYDMAPYVLAEIRQNSDATWFDALLARAPLGAALFALFDRSPHVAALRHERNRWSPYFTLRADLAARADKINAFHPHMTLCVHFDAPSTTELQATNAVRAYVPGNVLESELATRQLRSTMVRNLMDGHRWVESSVFTAAVVSGISRATKIPIKTDSTDFRAIKVSDGVYARNLALNRLVREGVMAYLEVLYYNHPSEFRMLRRTDRHAEIDGKKFDYSRRLDDVVDGLERGILDYVRSMEKRALAQLQ